MDCGVNRRFYLELFLLSFGRVGSIDKGVAANWSVSTFSWSDTLCCLTRTNGLAIIWVWIDFLMPLKTGEKDPL